MKPRSEKLGYGTVNDCTVQKMQSAVLPRFNRSTKWKAAL